MLPQEIIRKKREGGVLGADEITFMVRGLTDGSLSEGQVAAFAMAVFFRGMAETESVALTLAMRDSGTVIDWADLDGPVFDKHSTGAVGDNVSLMLAPAVAACGAYVPMISGRGLGHTGGTLDKLDSIPGYVSQPGLDRFRHVVADVGCAIIGQTDDLAPADRRLYAILDVKTGNGAFMQDFDDSRALAKSLVLVANGGGLRTSALITDMTQPLASAAGNAVEVLNAVDFLTGKHVDPRLHEVTVALGGEMLALGGIADNPDQGRLRIEEAFSSGRAAETFGRMVAALGGPADFIERAGAYLRVAPVVVPALPARSGFVTAIDTRAVGIAVVELGGGRARASDTIDPAVGFTGLAHIGDAVGPDRPLGMVHARSAAPAESAAEALRKAYAVGDAEAPAGPGIHDRIGPVPRPGP